MILIAKQRAFDEVRKKVVEAIIQDGKYHIELLITNPSTDNSYYNQMPEIGKVMSSLDLEYEESMKGLEYETIKAYRATQLDVENYYYRMDHDYQIDKYYYYAGLSYWNLYFQEHNIDMVVNLMFRHGTIWDIAMDVAEKQGKPIVYIESCGYHSTYTIAKDGMVQPIYTDGVASIEYVLESSYDKTHLDPTRLPKPMWRLACYKIGGNLLEDFGRRLLHWNWEPQSVSKKRYKAYWSEKLFGYLQLRRTEKYLEKLSRPYKKGEKFVFYALHFEPEAVTQVRNVLESQLTIIKMLSETLPEGWKLYVKEHPAQFKLNTDVGYYFMLQTPRFKTKKFYDKIASLKNVVIIEANTSSSLLIEEAQAVSSIVGTVFFEAVLLGKPMIVFSDLQPVVKMKDVFSIHSYNECKLAMGKIANGFQPDYSDAGNVVRNYIFKEEHMPENIVGLLHQYCPMGNNESC